MLEILLTAACVLILYFIWQILYDSFRFVVVSYTFTDPGIRKDCRAVVLADLHNKCYGRENEKLLEAIREAEPDVILVAGDILTATPGANMDVAIHLMQELAAQYPVYYGNGNHEHRLKLYPEDYGDMGERYEEALREAGVHLLVNAHETLGDTGICIYGAEIEREYYKRFRNSPMGEEYLKGLLGIPDQENYTLLLAHNPDYFPEYAQWGADLTLSGHIHGGIIRVPFLNRGVLSPAVRLFPKYDGGLFEEGSARMVLSRGLGMHTIPLRLFNPGELVVIDLKSN